MGGLLLWYDEENYLTLSWGQRRPDEISFEGNIDNRDLIFGPRHCPATHSPACSYATGIIDRAVYRDVHPSGTAVDFAHVQLASSPAT